MPGSEQTDTLGAAPPQGVAQQVSLQTASNSAPSFSSAFTKIVLITGKYKLPDKGPPGTAVASAQEDLNAALRGPMDPVLVQPEMEKQRFPLV